jgi:hypothetical protein
MSLTLSTQRLLNVSGQTVKNRGLIKKICRYRGRVGTSLSVLWVAYAIHSTLKLLVDYLTLFGEEVISGLVLLLKSQMVLGSVVQKIV